MDGPMFATLNGEALQWRAMMTLMICVLAVLNKTYLAPSNDTHDYLSWAAYYWPDCSNVGNTTALTPQQEW